tara:strand:- start:178 stop:837 length:660 start_codon:yes stop_codon:yes gene_type:complete
MTLSRTEKFDRAAKGITQQRGKTYGHPVDDFHRVSLIKEAVADCQNREIRHALEMIGVKMARLVTSPDHLDTIVDIAGYARTMVMVLDKQGSAAPARAKSREGSGNRGFRKLSKAQADDLRSKFNGVGWARARRWGARFDCSGHTVMSAVRFRGVYAADRPPVEQPNRPTRAPDADADNEGEGRRMTTPALKTSFVVQASDDLGQTAFVQLSLPDGKGE